MKVIVTGSLGHISQPLAKELIEKGHSVTIISSNPEKQHDIAARGAVAAIGSLEDPEFLVSVFTGADALYAMVPPNFAVPDSRAYYRKIASAYAKAIQQSGLKRVVHLSSMGAHLEKGTGFILGSYDAEGILNALQDVAITHLRPSYFYINLYNFANMIKTLGFIAANYGGDDKILMVDPRDIASAAADELEATVTGNHVRYVSSDELTGNEAAQILGDAIGKPGLKWITSSSEQMQQGMEEKGIPKHIVTDFVEMGHSIHTGILREDYDIHKPHLMGKVKLTDFAREFAKVF